MLASRKKLSSTAQRQSTPWRQISPRSAEDVRTALRAAGCRFTAQRAAVYAYLEQVHHHPTADEVYRAVLRRLPHVSLATVYKALDALVTARLANKLTAGAGSARYDCGGEEHYHLRDVETGEVCDLPIDFDPQLLKKLSPQLEQQLARDGFQITGYRLEVLGRFER